MCCRGRISIPGLPGLDFFAHLPQHLGIDILAQLALEVGLDHGGGLQVVAWKPHRSTEVRARW